MQLNLNRRFREAICDRIWSESAQVYGELSWLKTERIVRHNELFVFERFKPKGELKPLMGDDETGLECFLNKFHFSASTIDDSVATGLCIFARIDEIWGRFFGVKTGKLRQIVSIDPIKNDAGLIDGTYRFHFVRSTQNWLSADLDKYEEVMIVSD